MINKRNIITTKILSVAFLIASGIPAVAHEGFDHVIGTVAGVSGGILTVKTAKGNVDVKLDDKTEISKGTVKAQASDLKPGLRVVVDIPEDSKDRIAHSVKLGAAGATAHDGHDEHK
ncbi:MAG: hypothetical protein ABSG41_10635 [Bryobacteraceae bacterium]|jgi:hypothetical protein